MDLAARRVAVTGATGFIGRYLVRALQERGAHVVAVARNPAKLAGLGDVEPREAELDDLDALTRAFRGCDAVISNAGVVSIGVQSREALMRANAEGTRNVFTALHRAGVGRAVMTSSTSAYARRRASSRRAYVEGDPLWEASQSVSRPLYYALSKAVAEREAWRLAGEHDIALSVARPSGVYGAHDRTGFTSWLFRFTRMPLMTLFPTRLHVPNVYAGDLAEAMVRMLERGVAVGKAYNVAGDPSLSFWDMLEAFRRAGGRVPPVVVPVPVPLRFAYSLRRAERELDFANRDPVAAFEETLALDGAGR